MSNYRNLQNKLNALEDKLKAAEERLELKKVQLNEDHNATKDELWARYTYLQKQLKDETENMEAQGLHIGELESSVLFWLKSLDFDN